MSRRALRKRTCRAGGKKRTCRAGGKKRTLRNRTCRSKVRRGGSLGQDLGAAFRATAFSVAQLDAL